MIQGRAYQPQHAERRQRPVLNSRRESRMRCAAVRDGSARVQPLGCPRADVGGSISNLNARPLTTNANLPLTLSRNVAAPRGAERANASGS